MKSKRLLSLAMAAVMSMSALSYCASIKTPVGIVANAEVTYSATGTKVPLQHIQAKVTYSQEEIDKMWKKGNLQREFPVTSKDGWELYTWEGKKVTESKKIFNNDVGAYEYRRNSEKLKLTDKMANPTYFGVRFSYLNLKSQSSKNTTFRKYYGWVQIDVDKYVSYEEYESNTPSVDYFVELDENDTNETAKEKVDAGTNGKPRCKSSSTICEMKKVGSDYVAAFQTTGTSIAESDEAIYADLKRQEEEAAEKKAENKKNDYVSGKQSKWNGWNNVLNTSSLQKESKILYIDTNNTGKYGVVYIPPTGGKCNYTASDVEGLKKTCGVTDVEKAYVFEVFMPKGYELLDGKNAVVRLDLDHSAINANTDGYNVYLYHMVDGKAKRVRKIGWRMYYVVFAANSFSPYVLVLTPKDQKRGVASTGAVLYANPPTGEGDVVPVAMLAASALCMSCLLTVRRRKEQEV